MTRTEVSNVADLMWSSAESKTASFYLRLQASCTKASQSAIAKKGVSDLAAVVPPPIRMLSYCVAKVLAALTFSCFPQENAGNDPNTQIVPSGSGSSWQKVEEQAPPPADPRQSALTVGSTWASEKSRESGWQPPAPQIQTLPPPRAGARRLNPHEYPSLSAAAVARQQHLPKQRVPSVSDSQVTLKLLYGVRIVREIYLLHLSQSMS